MKKQSNLGRLLSYAGSRKILSYLSWVFAAVSALIALVPFWYIWRILKEVIEVAPNFGEAVNITHYGWMAVLFAVAAVLVYITGLMCSHMAAFRHSNEHAHRNDRTYLRSFRSALLSSSAAAAAPHDIRNDRRDRGVSCPSAAG